MRADAAAEVIRAYEPRDEEAILALVEFGLREHGFGFEREKTRAELGAAGVFVAEGARAIEGTIAIRPKEARVCELKRFYVDPPARGRGVGQALYEAAEAYARAQGYERIWLASSRRFVRAHRLYVRNGFALVASLDNDWEDDLFEKPLRRGPADATSYS